MTYSIYRIILFLALLMLSTRINLAQSILVTPDKSLIHLFPLDTCEQTCWMGLIPGTSTSEEVEVVLNNLETQFGSWSSNYSTNEIDTVTGFIRDGTYRFVWEANPRPLFGNFIDISDGIVDTIGLFPSELITLQQTIDILGLPDDVQLIREYRVRYLILVYIEELLQVQLKADETCFLSSFNSDFVVEAIIYYSPEAALAMVETDYGLQPNLLAYNFSSDLGRQVPTDIFQSWLNGEGEISCFAAVEHLPIDIQLPELSLAPYAESTTEPQATQTSR